MAKKLVDIVALSKSQQKSRFVWKKQEQSVHEPKMWPFTVVLILALIIFNLVSIGLNLNKNTEQVLLSAKNGIESLNIAKSKIQSTDFENSIQYFKQAQSEFENILSLTEYLDGSINTPVVVAKSITELTVIGEELAQVGQIFKEMPNKILELNKIAIQNPEADIPGYTDQIYSNYQKIQNSIAKIDHIILELKSLNLELLPDKYQQQFNASLDQLTLISNKLNESKNYLDAALVFLGHKVPNQILVMIQNNNELRGTGGFPGSLAFLEINKGILSEIKLVDVYDLDGTLVGANEKVPPEFKGFTKELFIRDSNYTPEFAVSAQRLEKLVQKAKGPSSDTVIAIDQHLIEDILSLTGPVTLPGYTGKITSANFNLVLNYLIEANQEQNVHDKGILQLFIAEFKKKFSDISDFPSLAKVLYQNLEQKHIQIYAKNEIVQSTVSKFGFSGSIGNLTTKNDFLLVTNTSIGGNKSDKYIHQKITHKSEIKSKNTIVNTLTIAKTNTFKNSEESKWLTQLQPFGISKLKNEVRYVLGRGDNISMVKVYVPLGAKLLSVKGIKPNQVQTLKDPDLNLTYFMFKTKLTPGQSAATELTYKVHRDLGKGPAYTYNLQVVPQAGASNVVFEKSYIKRNKFIPINQFTPYHYYPDGKYEYSTELNKNLELGVIFGL